MSSENVFIAASTLHSLRLDEKESSNVGSPPNQGHSVKNGIFVSEESQQDPPTKDSRHAVGLSSTASPSQSGGMSLKKANPIPYTRALNDITNEFRAAARDLPVGDLVIQDDFSLFESVSAVEIMDPKMDSGLLSPEETLEDHYDVTSDLTPEDAIGIMDQLICHEMAWHAGYPLARTLFTSHYIDRLLSSDGRQMDDFQFRNDPSAPLNPKDKESRPLVHKVLRAYCIGLIKCCGCALEEIERSWAPFYDEEDFSMNACGRQLLASLSVEQVDQQLAAAIDWANEQQKQASAISSELPWKAIATRLEARSLMVVALAGPPTGVGTDSWQIHWLAVSQEIPNVKLSHSLGNQVLGAFSSKIQRRLASTSPLRPVVETSFEEACGIWAQLATDCTLAWSNSRVVSESKQIGPIKDMLINFTARTPEPLAYARACCYLPFATASKESHEQWILSDIQELLSSEPAFNPDNWPSEPAPWIKRDDQDPKVQIATVIKDFVKVALERPDGYLAMYHAFCSNRSRLRRNLGHVVTGLESLQTNEADATDKILAGLLPGSMIDPISTWTYFTKCQIMEMVIGLGFEQDLYQPYEFASIFLYLKEITHTRERIMNYLRDVAIERSHEHGGPPPLSAMPLTRYYQSLASRYLAHALSNLYVHLYYLRLVPMAPDSPYADDFRCFELRMKPFWNVEHPSVALYHDFEPELYPLGPYDSNEPLDNERNEAFHNDTEAYFRAAKEAASKLIEYSEKNGDGDKGAYKPLMASCIALGVANAAIKNGTVGRLKVEIPSPDQRYHRQWPIPKVTEC